ncbi:MAG: Dyp-type peroxidase [Candidatus Thiodiazotropha lotti]|uniref:Peroxidase n=1 Tax=Candidatus Thiodiazotropha endoloripes TaxID=1818881 RepID=A0A1E2UTL4_9GAMM|nr:Dyp-type peroxidase [Candidatus Thiodiazotropha endoloripes]MCG7899462.1 Dyp-type peroxidase [Candidatus Thiodiazotropha weberae]MCG7990731.1 Dyp-type peroxidase [Candidatus Thiodiazotropha lotti]MCG7901370.1 Dyp-type peroxidase [Candidatus Thiodiazotropha weberae]MCG7915989.1 Dyp-type peroxidase [Candidatus Thiodiazotropha weberae]MCG7999404.1 Dyp-type peroxidase [Candidatus Thiodiazotropha lotti]
MKHCQPGILAQVPRLARYLSFTLKPDIDSDTIRRLVREKLNHEECVVGFGLELVLALGKDIDGLKPFPVLCGPGFTVPATPSALWIWLQGDDRGELLQRCRGLTQELSEAFVLQKVIDSFQYQDSRDLTGYEDGTENPEGEEAIKAGLVQGAGPGMDGSSFVAVQQWIHDLDHFQSLPQTDRDNIIGRRISDNEELDEAPPSAHVKRTAQEDFEPEAFILRRSMPWADEHQAGLVFVAFGCSLDAFEALLTRMTGKDDGICDALFRFSHPVSGSYYWCPPVKDGELDLSLLGLS